MVEKCESGGKTLLIENLDEEIDPVLDPLLGRTLIKKGRAIRLGDKEIEYAPKFQLYLHTKMANPHYKPELQAQTTLINFTVTRQGLEDQLLAEVVKEDRPDLEEQKVSICIAFLKIIIWSSPKVVPTRDRREYQYRIKSTDAKAASINISLDSRIS